MNQNLKSQQKNTNSSASKHREGDFGSDPKGLENKGKNQPMIFNKRTFCTIEEAIRKVKRQSTKREKNAFKLHVDG